MEFSVFYTRNPLTASTYVLSCFTETTTIPPLIYPIACQFHFLFNMCLYLNIAFLFIRKTVFIFEEYNERLCRRSWLTYYITKVSWYFRYARAICCTVIILYAGPTILTRIWCTSCNEKSATCILYYLKPNIKTRKHHLEEINTHTHTHARTHTHAHTWQ